MSETFFFIIVPLVLMVFVVLPLIIVIVKQRNELQDKNEFIFKLSNENSRLNALQESIENYRHDIETINENSKQSFTSAATDLFISTSSKLSEINSKSVNSLLQPLKEQIESLKSQIVDSKIKSAENKSSIEENIKNLVTQTQKISEDAVALTRALRGNKKLQGDWGESLLDTILKSSGLIEGVHYFNQKTYQDNDGKSIRPDVVVKLPEENSCLIIDSKVSLNSYIDYCNADTEEDCNYHLAKHVEALRNHVNELSNKDYSRSVNGAIGFVLMFVANEASYIVALGRDPGLQEYARQKKVIIVSPSNLMTALQLTLLLWKSELQRQNINRIIEQGSAIYDKFVLFTESFQKIGDCLTTAQDAYDTSLKRMSEGRDNIVNKLEKFRNLGLQTTKQISDKYLKSIDDEDSPSKNQIQ